MRRRSLYPAWPALLGIALGATATLAQGGAARRPRSFFHGGDAPVQVGATPAGVDSVDAEACSACHAEIAREWRASAHSRAWTDDVFQAAYAVEPMAFCRNCHAPRTDSHALHPSSLAAREGVSCAVCHVRAGTVLAAAHGTDAPPRRAPHPVMALRALGESTYCAGCHQFNFPADPSPARVPYATDEPMQDTYEEWAMSSAAASNTHCQDCHMPWTASPDGARHRSHRFPGGGDPELLARAVRVEMRAVREGEDLVVRATVAAGATGHSFPTGDLFRRGELRVWIAGREATAQTAGFAREFASTLEHTPQGEAVFVRRQSGDTRIPPPGLGAPRTLTFRFAAPNAAAPARVEWSLDHLLMPTPQAASAGFGDARVRTHVLTGALDVPASTAGDPQ